MTSLPLVLSKLWVVVVVPWQRVVVWLLEGSACAAQLGSPDCVNVPGKQPPPLSHGLTRMVLSQPQLTRRLVCGAWGFEGAASSDPAAAAGAQDTAVAPTACWPGSCTGQVHCSGVCGVGSAIPEDAGLHCDRVLCTYTCHP